MGTSRPIFSSLETLVDLPALKRLELWGDDEAAQVVGRMTNLERLTGMHCSRRGIKALRPLERLKWLALRRDADADWTEAEIQPWFPDDCDVVVQENR